MDYKKANMAARYQYKIPEGYEARIDGNKVIIELKEGDDENIIKWLIAVIEEVKTDDDWCADLNKCDEAITWLKKQKEQNPEDKDRYMEGYMNGMNDALKEQKPAEYEKLLLSKFEQAVYDCAWGKVTCKPEGETQEEYARRWAEHLLLMVRDWADDYIDSQIESAKRKAYDRGKADAEKPAEWSDEDEERIKSIKATLEQFAYSNGMLDVNGDYCDASIIKNMNWLKDLHTKVHMQPKQEWSEEDKKNLQGVIDEIEANKNAAPSYDIPTYDRFLSWLKSLRPQPHWKPSEEQLRCLEFAIKQLERNYLIGPGRAEDKGLYQLVNDLKKL